MIHQNSKESLRKTKPAIQKRIQQITEALDILIIATDREIKEWLDFEDINSVRPRITEGIRAGLFVECESVVCKKMGRRVRRVRLAISLV